MEAVIDTFNTPISFEFHIQDYQAIIVPNYPNKQLGTKVSKVHVYDRLLSESMRDHFNEEFNLNMFYNFLHQNGLDLFSSATERINPSTSTAYTKHYIVPEKVTATARGNLAELIIDDNSVGVIFTEECSS